MNLATVLGFRGRLNRTSYALNLVPYLAVLALFLYFESSFRRYGDLGEWTSIAVVALMLWIFIAAMAKRFHDIGQSGWMVLLTIVPLVGQLTPFVLLVYPGNQTDNEYGKA